MYNLNSHYENLFQYLRTIVTHPRVLYLTPFGSTQPENIETLSDDLAAYKIQDGPLFVFYDQEPIYGEYNYPLFDHIAERLKRQTHTVLVTTEQNSDPLNHILERYNWHSAYYFHHIFAAHDWFRGSRYDVLLKEPKLRRLTKKYITFNRLTSSNRVYRSLLIAELANRDLLDQGYVSYNDTCPDGGTYQDNLQDAYNRKLITQDQATSAINTLNQLSFPLRIDYQDHSFIPNHSFVLSATKQTQESFLYLVTETCYWERKCHLTEKIFKPIVSHMPFVLAGPAHNLKYLRSYGFKTFGQWWDESYDDIEDPILRMQAIGELMSKICSYSLEQLKDMLVSMQEVLDHNHNLFYSQDFLDYAWNELKTNITTSARLHSSNIEPSRGIPPLVT